LINIQNFNVDDLFQKLFEKIRANHPSIKILIVSWITFLDSIPDIKLINFLPELLPGLFNMLCDKTKDVNQSAEKSLKHFKKQIETNFDSLSNNECEVNVLTKILEILIEQCKSSHDQARLTAFEWMFMLLQKYLIILSNFYNKNFKIQSSYYAKINSTNGYKTDFFRNEIKSGTGVNKFSLTDEAISRNSISAYNSNKSNKNLININSQPEFSFKLSPPQQNNSKIHAQSDGFTIDNQTCSQVDTQAENSQILKIPFYLFHRILDVILVNVNSTNEQILSLSLSCNSALVKMSDYFSHEITSLKVKQFEEVLKNYFDSKKESTIDLILNWIRNLFRKFHDEMFTKVDLFIDSFTNILSDSNENVRINKYDIFSFLQKYLI
jgi:hypothetical protein